jgi:DNA-binding MarR family transcriptional regulator
MPARQPSDLPVLAAADAAPRGCTNLKLRQANRRITRHYEAHLAPTGLKITQYSLLSYVVKLGPLPSGALAIAMQMDASTLSRNLQPLLRQGWLHAGTGADTRCRIVEATPEGHALRARAQKAWKNAQQALNQRLGPVRVAALHALLDECLVLLDQPKRSTADE